ncbi:MAG: T9SS type A sorting domain-containing protein [Aquaticitalea sp.]
MKQFLLLIFVLPFLGFGQCPNGTFNSQAQIDALAIDYPNCTSISGSLIIEGDDITDLSGLAQIEQCQNLIIRDNPLLQNLNGLNSNIVLYYVEGIGNLFSITNNSSLTSIIGLENLVNNSDFESSLIVDGNPLLISLEGLPINYNPSYVLLITNNDSLTNLVGIGNYSGGYITEISDNDNLIDLTGLNSASGEGYVRISGNNSLTSFNGLNYLSGSQIIIENNAVLEDINITNEFTDLYPVVFIRQNPLLSVCNANWVCEFLNSSGVEENSWFPGTFSNNAPGCNTNFEVEYGCGLVTNDNCGFYDESSYLVLGETIVANNEFATTSTQVPSCDEVTERLDVWFAFDSGNLTSVDVISEAGYSLQLWEGTEFECGSEILVENACNAMELIDIPVTPNTIYLIQVWSDGTARRASGWFEVTVQDSALSVPEVALSDIKIYPNPANDVLNIQSNAKVDKVSIYNMLGQKVLESTYNTNEVSVNISSLNKGMYMAIVSSEGRASTYRIVKQ